MSGLYLSGTQKSSGKTLVATGLARALNGVRCFKKGPDYIDPMWLRAASENPVYNLDFNTQTPDEITRFYRERAGPAALIEGTKGLFDGVATDGSDSNAALAGLLDASVVLVVPSSGMTRGIAPLILGYQAFDPGVNLRGVILNNVRGQRHETKLRTAVETYTDLPVLGALRQDETLSIEARHLGLRTPVENTNRQALIDRLAAWVRNGTDIDQLGQLCRTGLAAPVTQPNPVADVRIGIARDAAFSFYYEDDLEAFAKAGARLVPFSPLSDQSLPDVDGLFLGGGFPEVQAGRLAANAPMLRELKAKIDAGLPVYAECGGLMLLSRAIIWRGENLPMAGVIEADAVVHPRPQGRGYARFQTLPGHPWDPPADAVNAHEFHYARLENWGQRPKFSRRVARGSGIENGLDGLVINKLVAGFCHLRQTGQNDWVERFVSFVRGQT